MVVWLTTLLCTLGPVSTGMGDRYGIQLPVQYHQSQ